MTILVIEHSESASQILKKAFQGPHPQITTVNNLGDAKKAFATDTYDVVLLNADLPDVDGIEAVKQVRGATEACLLVWTVHEDISFGIQSIEAGADQFMEQDELKENKIMRTVFCTLTRLKRDRDFRRETKAELSKLQDSIKTMMKVPFLQKESRAGG